MPKILQICNSWSPLLDSMLLSQNSYPRQNCFSEKLNITAVERGNSMPEKRVYFRKVITFQHKKGLFLILHYLTFFCAVWVVYCQWALFFFETTLSLLCPISVLPPLFPSFFFPCTGGPGSDNVVRIRGLPFRIYSSDPITLGMLQCICKFRTVPPHPMSGHARWSKVNRAASACFF